MSKRKPSELELQVLAVLWEQGPSTVRQVLAATPDKKARAYTTMLSVLQVMEKKGLVAHRREGTTHVYRPRVKKRQILRPLLRTLTRNVFGGDPAAVLHYLVDDSSISDEQVQEIRAIVDHLSEAHRSKPDKGGRS